MSWGHQIPRSPAGRDHQHQQRSYRPPASPSRTPVSLPLRPSAVTPRARASSSGSYDDYRGEQQRHYGPPAYHHPHHRGGVTATPSPNSQRRIISRKVEHFRDSPTNSYDEDNRGRRRGRRSVDDQYYSNSSRPMIPRSGMTNMQRRRGSIDSHSSDPVGEGIGYHSRGRIGRGQMPLRAQSYDTGDAYGSNGSRFSTADRYRHSGPPNVVSDAIRRNNNLGRPTPSPSSSSSTRLSPSSSSSPGYVVGSDAAYIDHVLTPDNIDMSQFTIHSFERKNKKSGGEPDADTSIEDEEDITSFLSKPADDDRYEITYYHSVQYRNEVVWILETKCIVSDSETHYEGDMSRCTLSKNSNDGVVCIKVVHKNGVDESDNPMEALSASYSSFSASPRTSVSPPRGRGDGSSRARSMSPGPLYSRSRSTSRSENPDANKSKLIC